MTSWPDSRSPSPKLRLSSRTGEPVNSPSSAGTPAAHSSISDVQGDADTRRVAIDKVGITGLRHPISIRDRSDKVMATVAVSNLYVALPHHQRGTHMSRLIEIANQRDRILSVASFRDLLSEVALRLDAAESHVEMRFPFFLTRPAPVSGALSSMNYEVSLTGGIERGKHRLRVGVSVPVTSLSPGSKASASRAAQSHRTHVALTVEALEPVWIEELIELAERHASSPLYAVLKRPDEKFVTEQAYDNPKFVEDIARDVALGLSADRRVQAYLVEVESEQSGHNHAGFAAISSPTWRPL